MYIWIDAMNILKYHCYHNDVDDYIWWYNDFGDSCAPHNLMLIWCHWIATIFFSAKDADIIKPNVTMLRCRQFCAFKIIIIFKHIKPTKLKTRIARNDDDGDSDLFHHTCNLDQRIVYTDTRNIYKHSRYTHTNMPSMVYFEVYFCFHHLHSIHFNIEVVEVVFERYIFPLYCRIYEW